MKIDVVVPIAGRRETYLGREIAGGRMILQQRHSLHVVRRTDSLVLVVHRHWERRTLILNWNSHR